MAEDRAVRRIVMTRSVASQWLVKQARPEYRMRVFNPLAKDYTSVLRSFRDGKLKMAGVSALPDLGVKEDFGGFYVWSSDATALKTLQTWFERRGLETTGIW